MRGPNTIILRTRRPAGSIWHQHNLNGPCVSWVFEIRTWMLWRVEEVLLLGKIIFVWWKIRGKWFLLRFLLCYWCVMKIFSDLRSERNVGSVKAYVLRHLKTLNFNWMGLTIEVFQLSLLNRYKWFLIECEDQINRLKLLLGFTA